MKNGSVVLVSVRGFTPDTPRPSAALRAACLSAAFLATSAFGCGMDPWTTGDSEIVFGLEQSKDDSGKVVTTANYELLALGGKGWRTRGFVDRGRSCWVERLDDRLGQPRMESGDAVFRGGKLPQDGLAIHANQHDDTKLDGPAWASGDRLFFDAQGFAMPDVSEVALGGPSPDLPVSEPDASAQVALHADADFVVKWDTADVPELVVVALEVASDAERGSELRCFFDRSAGTGTVPKEFVAALPDTSDTAKGKLRVATHRQVSILSRGEWVIYVVADAVARVQPFTLARTAQ